MEVDPITIAVVIFLLIVVGIFVGTQMGGASAGNSIKTSSPSYQVGGGGCIR